MKDKEARRAIKRLDRGLVLLQDRVPTIFAKYCNKCKHATAQVRAGDAFRRIARCLSCGTLWECDEETGCKEV